LGFDAKEFLPATLLAKVTDVRVTDPERPLRAARERKRRERLTKDGKPDILYPGDDDDPLAVMESVGGIIHRA